MKCTKIILLFFIAALMATWLTGCATTSSSRTPGQQAGYDDEFKLDDEWDAYDEPLVVKDPFEGYNRFMFGVNNKIYTFIFNPLSNVYDFLIPKKIQGSVNNFVQAIGTPKRLFNNILQGKPKAAMTEVGRLLVNATLGIGGLFDPADRVFNLKQQNEDFGQTLGSYGMETGTYIIWPVIGPSTTRESIGFAVDAAFNPLLWFGVYDVAPQDGFRAISLTKRVNNYSYTTRDAYKRLTENALDPYISMQYAFIQNREKKVKE